MKSISHSEQSGEGKVPGEDGAGSDSLWLLSMKQHEYLLATHGKTFAFASRFFPVKVRHAVVSLYAFFRTLDDLVDERNEGWSRSDAEQELEAWQDWFASGASTSAPREPLGTIIAALQETYQIPVTLFYDFLYGLRSDLDPVLIYDFRELYQYCYRVAGTVGIAMTYVLGARSVQAQWAAKQLGVAMQLTNILRDLGSDLAVGRSYLPLIELVRFDLSPERLFRLYQARQGPDEQFCALMRYQIQRARSYYQAGLHGAWLLDPSCRIPVLLAGRLYQRILARIEQKQYDVLRSRAVTAPLTKLREAGIVWLLDLLWRLGETKASSEQERFFYED